MWRADGSSNPDGESYLSRKKMLYSKNVEIYQSVWVMIGQRYAGDTHTRPIESPAFVF